MSRVLLLDLDDCSVGPIWPFPDRPRRPVDRQAFGKLLTALEKARVSVHLLTNRPPGQLPVIAQIVGGPARYHLAESGLSAWLPDENRAIVNPRYREFATGVRGEMLALLRQHLDLSPDGPILEEYGDRLVTYTVFPLGGDHEAVAALVTQVRELLGRGGFDVDVRQGKGVDIMPAGANKLEGCHWAEKLHPELQGEELKWSDVLYVEDSTTGLQAARYVLDQGGQVAVVSNGAEELKALVQEGGGYLCEQDGEAGTLEAVTWWLEKT